MIKGKVFVSLLVIALMAAMVGGATMAVFTSEASNEGNTFGTGNLAVEAGSQLYGVNIDNMAPGDTIAGSFEVSNEGSLELYYVVAAQTSGDLFEGNLAPVVSIIAGGAGVLGAEPDADPAATATVSYTIDWPLGVDVDHNDYQGATGSLSFEVNAVQTANHDYVEYFN